MADPYASQDRELAAKLGVEISDFETSDEYTKFTGSFERQFVLYYKERRFATLYERNVATIRVGAKAAKAQFKQHFGGEHPDSHEFGMVVPRAAYFGIGSDWDKQRPITADSPTYLIDSGTRGIGGLYGTSGNPVKIGGNALHVIFGVGTMATSPLTEALRFTINEKPQTPIITWYHYLISDLKFREIGKVYIFKKDTTILLEGYSSTSGQDVNYLIGASFLPWNVLKEIDVTKLSGTTPDVILAT